MERMKKVLSLALGMMLALGISVLLSVNAYADGDGKAQAEVGGKQYASVEEALAAAAQDDTITLLSDGTEDLTVDAGKAITLDLNGKTLTGSITSSGALTITDGAETGTVTGNVTKSGSGSVTINGGRFDGLITGCTLNDGLYNLMPEEPSNTLPGNLYVFGYPDENYHYCIRDYNAVVAEINRKGIGRVFYDSLENAVQDAENGEKVSVAWDISIKSTIHISKNIELNLNGYILNGTEDAPVIEVDPGCTLTISSFLTAGGVYAYHSDEPWKWNEATSQSSYDAKYTALGSDPREGTLVNVPYGCITGGSVGILVKEGASLVMNQGTVLGNTVGVDNYGTFTMNGGTIIGNGPAKGGAITNESGATLSINDGEVLYNTISNKGTVNVSGGSFTDCPRTFVSSFTAKCDGVWYTITPESKIDQSDCDVKYTNTSYNGDYNITIYFTDIDDAIQQLRFLSGWGFKIILLKDCSTDMDLQGGYYYGTHTLTTTGSISGGQYFCAALSADSISKGTFWEERADENQEVIAAMPVTAKTISGGSFQNAMEGSTVTAEEITGGDFFRKVIVSGTISGGSFSSGASLDAQKGSIQGGTFYILTDSSQDNTVLSTELIKGLLAAGYDTQQNGNWYTVITTTTTTTAAATASAISPIGWVGIGGCALVAIAAVVFVLIWSKKKKQSH